MYYHYDTVPFDFSSWYSAIPGGAIVFGWLLAALSIAALWIIFTKAHEEGWAAIVPFYNSYVLFKITWGSGWLFLLLLIPIVNFVIWIITMVKLSEVFGQGGGFACGLIFLNFIFECILAFDSKYQYLGVNGEYAGDYGPGASGPYRDPNAQTGYQSQPGYQNPYGQQQNAYRQSPENGAYYYKDTAAPTQSAAPAENDAPNDAQSGAQPGVKFCMNCGTKLEHGEKFCPKCGTRQ